MKPFVLALAVLANAAPSWAQPLSVGGDPKVDPLDFRVTTFASGLNFPSSMQRLADGSLLVATSDPTGGSLFNSTGRLVRLVDSNQDGLADAGPQTLYTGLPGTVTSVRTAGNLVFATSSTAAGPQIAVLRAGATPATPLVSLGSLNFAFPSEWDHLTYSLAARNAPGLLGHYDLFFNVGSQLNETSTAATVGLSGMATGSLSSESIYRITVDNRGAAPVFGFPTQIATGLRNAAGMAFEPLTGDLYFEDNGIDLPSNRPEPLSADELNRISAAQIGGAVEDFGFSEDYIEYRTGTRIGSGGVQPLVAFQPLNSSESEGAVEIAFAPTQFPQGLNNGVFVGFFGEFGKAGIANQENPVAYVDLATGEYFHFISNNEPLVGHLDGLLATSDSLFLADLSSSGEVNTAGTGVIYQITALPPPLPGDANRDGLVDGADYTAWADHFLLPGNFSAGDFNRDGFIDGADYTVWADHFSPAPLSISSVPEPSTVALAAIGVVALLVHAVHRRFSN